jgi:hypothetical protein
MVKEVCVYIYIYITHEFCYVVLMMRLEYYFLMIILINDKYFKHNINIDGNIIGHQKIFIYLMM